MRISAFIKFLALLLIALMFVACATPSQVYWDHKVKDLCEKDGGVTVYEKVELTKEERNKLRIVPASEVTDKDDYYLQGSTENINDNPKVRRYVDIFYRNFDKKIMGKKIGYSRVGGDIPTGISHPSAYSCDQVLGFKQLTDEVFIIKGE